MPTSTDHDETTNRTTMTTTNTKAVIAFATVFALPPLGFVFAILAHREIRRSSTNEGGSGYATAAIVLSLLWLVLLVASIAVFWSLAFPPRYADYLNS